MSKERGLTDYLSDDWGLKKGGDADSDSGIPAREDMPPEPQRGYGEDGNTGGYGHSSEVTFDPKASVWGLSKDEVAKGYEGGESDGDGAAIGTRQPYGSNPQAVPSTNEWDRGAGSETRSREFSSTEGRAFDGTGSKYRTRTGFGSSSPTG
jgi:hypothetical protein